MPPGKAALLRAAMVSRLGNINDLTGYPKIPDSANVPCYWIAPDKPFVDYQQYFRNGLAQWNFLVEIITNRQDIESAQDILDEYVDPDGPFVTRLQAQYMGDDLAELTNDTVEVLTASRYGSYKIGNTAYLGVQLFVQLFA